MESWSRDPVVSCDWLTAGHVTNSSGGGLLRADPVQRYKRGGAGGHVPGTVLYCTVVL